MIFEKDALFTESESPHALLPIAVQSNVIQKGFRSEMGGVIEMLQAFRSFIGENQMMAYPVRMAVRLNLGSRNAVNGCAA
ncbi:MAG: hypothetical protein ABI878_15500 [Acidobacteriota bacterium]